MQGFIKIADRMEQTIIEEQSMQNKPVQHAKAISNGVRNIGQKSILRRTFVRNSNNNSEDPRLNIGRANFVALMRSYSGMPIAVAERKDPQATSSIVRCVHPSCSERARSQEEHGLGCKSMAGLITKRHDALCSAILECAMDRSNQGKVTAVEHAPAYRGLPGVTSDGRLYRFGGDNIDFDVRITHAPSKIVVQKGEQAGVYLRAVREPIQEVLDAAATEKARHYENANKRQHERIHPDVDFVGIGGSDEGIELRVSDLVPLIFDSSGTPQADTATWLKKVIPDSNWRKFEDLVSHIMANYYGSILRSAPTKWATLRNARKNRGRRSHRASARTHDLENADGVEVEGDDLDVTGVENA